LLPQVREAARHSFIYPMFVFVAHTRARRSEILRSQIDDFDFDARIVKIREKKRSKKNAITYRHVPMTALLQSVMQSWFATHPGGKHTFCTLSQGVEHNFAALTVDQAVDHFKRTIADTGWKCVRGFHVFRHSFASNLAAAAVDQRIIDEWMGHQTDELRRRYRHHFPEQQRRAIDLVFGRGEQQQSVA
ncbi:MAG: tyrosine-type recombinase/integrase, partial [Planctomycetota bacterium]